LRNTLSNGAARCRDVPIEFKNLLNLKHLELNENDFKVIPDGVYKLSNLEILSLEKNKIKFISEEIKNWKSLRVSGRCAPTPDISRSSPLIFPMQELNLNTNQITLIPPEIGQLKSLVKLFLATNKLQKFPDEGFFSFSLSFLVAPGWPLIDLLLLLFFVQLAS